MKRAHAAVEEDPPKELIELVPPIVKISSVAQQAVVSWPSCGGGRCHFRTRGVCLRPPLITEPPTKSYRSRTLLVQT